MLETAWVSQINESSLLLEVSIEPRPIPALIGPPGKAGRDGDPGTPGPPGEGAPDPGNLMIYFENGLT
ncbi:hypothetical protein [Novosphingobium sp.]|uniref:hypothetical protein n=1 Tax=Novosphingobium sp. TaxID=1874826 RepID=UPI001EB8FCDA|nr:hypothetical protein [Novosphingobium sp.]MBK9009979.1 hypothetical protein [Novosphingobium sp.]